MPIKMIKRISFYSLLYIRRSGIVYDFVKCIVTIANSLVTVPTIASENPAKECYIVYVHNYYTF